VLNRSQTKSKRPQPYKKAMHSKKWGGRFACIETAIQIQKMPEPGFKHDATKGFRPFTRQEKSKNKPVKGHWESKNAQTGTMPGNSYDYKIQKRHSLQGPGNRVGMSRVLNILNTPEPK